jgi:hypothetical protein
VKAFLVLVAAFALYQVDQAADQPAEKKHEQWDGSAKPLKGDYQVYGGTLSEVVPPTKNDRKVAFMFTGALAKDLFDKLGPDAKPSCSDALGYRERNRRDLSCTYTKEDGYTCYFGIDVTTGRSTRGSIC